MTPTQTDLQRELAALLVDALNLDIAPESIDPEAALYGEGLGLDFQLRSDDEENVRIFKSLASLADHVAAHRKH